MLTRLALLFAALCLALLLVACDLGQPSTPTPVSQPIVPTATAGLPVSADATEAPSVPPDTQEPQEPQETPTEQPMVGPQGSPVALTGHPRLFIRPDDVTRLRSWAVDSNPLWRQGLVPLANQARADMDAGRVPGQWAGGVAGRLGRRVCRL